MAKHNWLNKQLDQANTVVRSWSQWKRETIRSQIGDVEGTSSAPTVQKRSAGKDSEREVGPSGKMHRA